MPMMLWQLQSPTAEHILEVTREILSRSEFGAASAWQQWLYHLAKQANQKITDFAHWLQAHPTLQWIVFGILSLLLLGLLVHLGRLMWSETKLLARPRAPRHDGHGVSLLPNDAPDWGAVQQEIRQALKQGDAYRAIWRLHRYFLVVLDRRGLLTFSRWKTNADYLRECPGTHPVHATLKAMSEVYEHIVYAHRDVPLQTIDALLSQVEHDQDRLQP